MSPGCLAVPGVRDGEMHRDVLSDEDVVFSTASRNTHLAANVVFAAIMADAVMIERVIEMDVLGVPVAHRSRAAADSAGRRPASARRLTQWQIEGEGGVAWYEACR